MGEPSDLFFACVAALIALALVLGWATC